MFDSRTPMDKRAVPTELYKNGITFDVAVGSVLDPNRIMISGLSEKQSNDVFLALKKSNEYGVRSVQRELKIALGIENEKNVGRH